MVTKHPKRPFGRPGEDTDDYQNAQRFLKFIDEPYSHAIRAANDWAEHRPDLYVAWRTARRLGVE